MQPSSLKLTTISLYPGFRFKIPACGASCLQLKCLEKALWERDPRGAPKARGWRAPLDARDVDVDRLDAIRQTVPRPRETASQASSRTETETVRGRIAVGHRRLRVGNTSASSMPPCRSQ